MTDTYDPEGLFALQAMRAYMAGTGNDELAWWAEPAEVRGRWDRVVNAVHSATPRGRPWHDQEGARAELRELTAVCLHVGGEWPDNPTDAFPVRHVKWMARELRKQQEQVEHWGAKWTKARRELAELKYPDMTRPIHALEKKAQPHQGA